MPNNKLKIENEVEIEKEKDKKINQVLEDMCIYGNIMKKEIIEEKVKNPEKFIKIENALKKEKEDQGLFALGLLAKSLEDSGVETAIESENISGIDENENDAGTTCLQFITNGMMSKKKYDLHFDFGEERNEEILYKEEEYNKFKEQLKLKLSKDYNIEPEKIIVTFPEKGSLRVQVIFQSDEFNNLNKKDFLTKFQNDKDFGQLKHLKEVHSDLVMSGCKLTKSQLDKRGNRVKGWGVNEKRGKIDYFPPLGWIGIGLKVLDKYDDNIWIGMENKDGEWCVAYHGVGRRKNPKEVKDITREIVINTFEGGSGQEHEKCNDIFHSGKKVGRGVYCTPSIDVALRFSGISKIDSNGQSYKTVLMVRVNPSARRKCSCKIAKDYWVVNGTTEEIRPYRILYKKME